MNNIADQGVKIALNLVKGVSAINKFGENKDVDSAAEETVWSHGGDFADHIYTGNKTLYISSTDATDDKVIRVFYQDENANEKETTVTLNGQNQVEIAADIEFVYRAFNDNGNAFLGTLYIAESDTLTGGVPNTETKIKATIDPEEQQTMMSIYRIPAGYIGLLRGFYFSILRDSPSGTSADFKLCVKAENKACLTKVKRGLSTNGNSSLTVELQNPIRLEEKSYVYTNVSVSNDNSRVTAGFNVELYKKDI